MVGTNRSLGKTILLVSLVLLLAMATGMARGQSSGRATESKARRFDEFMVGIGSPRHWSENSDKENKDIKIRLQRYAKQLRIEHARAYIIGYSPRIRKWENYDRSYGEMRAGEAKSQLSEFFDPRRITSIDGGFREVATTELWIVPPGAKPPQPTPTVRPEEVSQCPFLLVTGASYIPKPSGPLEFKAEIESNDPRIRPTFTWRVSKGEIVSGQGTDTIEVEVPTGATGGIVAMVSLGGYSLECPLETLSATASTVVGVRHFLFDEFGNINCEVEALRLDNLANTLLNYPNLQVHIVFYGGRTGSRNYALARAARMKSYLVQTRGLKDARIFTLDGGYRNEVSGELWLSSRGTTAPPLSPTVDKKYVREKGRPISVSNKPCSFDWP
jgi:hypothetical protein